MPDFKFDSDSDDEKEKRQRKPRLPFLDSDSDDDYFTKRKTLKIFDSDSDEDTKLKKPGSAGSEAVNYNQLVQMSRGVRDSPKPESPRPPSSITTHALISAAVPQTTAPPPPAATSLAKTTTFANSDSAKTISSPKSQDSAAAKNKIESIVTLNPLISSKTMNANSQPTSSSIDTFRNRSDSKKSSNSSDSKAKFSSTLTSDFDRLTIKKNFKETIDRIILHEPYSLDVYKSRTEKEALLAEAIRSFDGNAILAVMMHIKRTLARHVFYEIAQKYTVALNQYRNHLEQVNAKEDLLDMYKWQNRHVEAAALTHFKSILMDKHDIKIKESMMDDFINKYGAEAYQSISTSQLYQSVKKYMVLLKIQAELLKNKTTFLRKEKPKQDAIDRLYPSSLSYTVSFWLKYSRDLLPNEQYSEENFKRQFELQNKQYAIWFVIAMSEAGYWTELDRFLNQKGILNIVKNPVLPYETVFNLIADAKGPNEQLTKYLSLVEDTETKKSLAVKFKLVDIAVEAFKAQKDRIGLLSFREQFSNTSVEYLKISQAVSDPRNKWRN